MRISRATVIFTPLLLSLLTLHSLAMVPAEALKVQLAYPAYSLDPRTYDDWSSVFIANHIYARLLPLPSKPWLRSVAKDFAIECTERVANGACTRNRISFEIQTLTDCSGRAISADEIRGEFFSILKAKSWLLPGWDECKERKAGACVELPAHGDLERRLQAIYFRFGWSHPPTGTAPVGAGAYCLSDVTKNGTLITGGKLLPKDDSALPTLTLGVSQESSTTFNLALQGTSSLLRASRKNVQPHTPLPYYVVTNPALSGVRLPWNEKETAALISAHLQQTGMAYDAPQSLLDVVPGGEALRNSSSEAMMSKKGLTFLLPDYLPECERLASGLNEKWKATGFIRDYAKCGSLVELMEKHVHAPDGSKEKWWDGFLISLSPGAPERGAIYDQYFSPDSAESLTRKAVAPGRFFYRVGMGQSLVTVDGQTICDVAPTSLGLGDLTAGDLIQCKAGVK